EGVAHGARVGERAEVTLPLRARAAVEGEPREAVLVAQMDRGKALVIAQHDVEAWLVRLDEVVLEQQRLGLGVGDRDLDGRDLLHERLHLGIDVARGEVRAHAILQAPRLADIEQLLLRPEHAIDAGALGERCEERLVIEHPGLPTRPRAPPARAVRRARRRAPLPRGTWPQSGAGSGCCSDCSDRSPAWSGPRSVGVRARARKDSPSAAGRAPGAPPRAPRVRGPGAPAPG